VGGLEKKRQAPRNKGDPGEENWVEMRDSIRQERKEKRGTCSVGRKTGAITESTKNKGEGGGEKRGRTKK